MAEETRESVAAGSEPSVQGPVLAKIVSHLDPTYMGILEVQILREAGNDDAATGQLHQVKYLSPFAGSTSVDYIGSEPDNYNNTQKSYGMWMIPPDVGSVVMVVFVDGDPRKGYWIGCVQDNAMNFSVPGYAATSYHVDGTEERVPVAEYNKLANPSTIDPTQIKKPASPFQDVLIEQGLIKDDVRGITTSSARREVPSAVFGISTPGPIDKTNGAKTGKVGKAEDKIANAFVSRLGGSSFVMDDGDDKYLRKTPPGEGPPEYAAVEQGETDGDPTIPHNELVRIRTRTGHQILLHNSEDLIYIGNAKGTTWIELTSNGKIDIYAQDSISIHTERDFNVTADRDINFTSNGGNINLNAKSNVNITATQEFNIKASASGKLSANGLDIKSSGDSRWSGTGQVSFGGNKVIISGSSVDINGAAAPAANEATAAEIAPRVPEHEPWAGHENLHEQELKYSTTTDTFSKLRPPENTEGTTG
jgi:hypothetical protein